MRPQTLDDFRGECKPSGSQINYRQCPMCKSTGWKTYVNPDDGTWICFAGACGGRGRVRVSISPSSLLQRLHGKQRGTPDWPEVGLPQHQPLGDLASKFVQDKYKMDLSRYFLQEGASEFMQGRVIIPYCNARGEIIYWSARSFDPAVEPKYHAMGGRHPLYVPAYVSRTLTVPPLVIVEGAFDAMKAHACGEVMAVALGGKQLPRYLLGELLALGRGEVVVMLDSDALQAALRLVRQLEPFVERVRCVTLPTGEDPGSMEPDVLGRFLKDELYDRAEE